MSESIPVSEEFYEFVFSHKREDETMEAVLRRLIGGPRPEDVSGILSSETGEAVREHLAEASESSAADLRETWE